MIEVLQSLHASLTADLLGAREQYAALQDENAALEQLREERAAATARAEEEIAALREAFGELEETLVARKQDAEDKVEIASATPAAPDAKNGMATAALPLRTPSSDAFSLDLVSPDAFPSDELPDTTSGDKIAADVPLPPRRPASLDIVATTSGTEATQRTKSSRRPTLERLAPVQPQRVAAPSRPAAQSERRSREVSLAAPQAQHRQAPLALPGSLLPARPPLTVAR
jgi:DNA-binding protein H-NS